MRSTVQTPVFVYGTLKPGGFYHDTYCGGFRFDAEAGQVKGELFELPSVGYPGAIESEANHVKGFLLTFHHSESEVLEKLDLLEGYDEERRPEENEYYRTRVSVFDENRRVLCDQAWCYFMKPEKITRLNGVLLESGCWPI